MSNLAGVLNGRRKSEEAERLHRDTLEIKRKALGNDHGSVGISRESLGIVPLRRLPHPYGALRRSRKGDSAGAQLFSAGRKAEHKARRETALKRLVALYEAWGKPEEAAKYWAPGTS